MRLSLALAPFLSLFFILSAWATPVQKGPPPQWAIGNRGGRLSMATLSLPKTFNYYLASETSSEDILGQMYLGLVQQNAVTLDYEPSLAESWKISNDNMTYTFKLREGLKWSDGQPITADDVVFTFNNIINNENIPNNSRNWLMVADQFPEVTKIDDLTVKIVTAEPFAPFMGSLGTPIMPMHILVSSLYDEIDGEIIFNKMWGVDADVQSIVVSGAWKLKEYVDGEQVVLEPNPYFYRKDAEGNSLPYLSEIVIKKEDPLSAFEMGQTGVVDLALFRGSAMLVSNANEVTFKELGPATDSSFVVFNMSTAKDEKGKPVVDPIKSKWFRNVKFRQAMAHAIHKEGIIQSVYKGLATPQESHIPQQNPFYNPDVPRYPFDLNKAAAILKEAGFVKDASGTLKDPDGHPVEFNLVTNAGNSLRDATCAILRKDWGKLGIKVNYNTLPFNVLVNQIDQTLDWDAMMLGSTSSSIEPHGGINSWKLDGPMHMFNMGGNAFREGQPTHFQPWEREVLALYEQGAQVFDFEKRKAIYNKAQVIVAEQVPYLFTVNALSPVAYRNWLGNIHPSIHGGPGLNRLLWNSEYLYIKPKL